MSLIGGIGTELKKDVMKIVVTIAIVTAGIVLTTFGFMWSGFAVVLYAFYRLLPGEGKIMADAYKSGGASIPFAERVESVKKAEKIEDMTGELPHVKAAPLPAVEAKKVAILGGEHIGLIYAKSVLKLMIIIFVAIESFRFHLLIPIAICFAAYFTMPTKYRTDQPYKSAEAWIRMGFGFMIAVLLLVFLSPGTTGLSAVVASLMTIIIGLLMAVSVGLMHSALKSLKLTILVLLLFGILGGTFLSLMGGFGSPAVSIFFLALAFFATMPERVDVSDKTVVEINLAIGQKLRENVGKLYEKEGWAKHFGNGLFLGLVLIAGIPIVFTWMGGQMIALMLIVWIMSLFVGYTSGREGRPPIGVIMLFFAIFAFSYQYTGTIGTSVFGQYWPAVYNTASLVIDPMSSAMDSASTSISDAYLAVTCPSCYQAEMERRRQLASGIKSGGTTHALELAGFEALNYMTQEIKLDPTIPLVGYIELENKGEFVANDVVVRLGSRGDGKPVLQDPALVSAADPHRGEVRLDNDKCVFTECTGTAVSGGSSCSWSAPSRPEDVKIMNFKCGKPEAFSSWSDDLKVCECRDAETGEYVADASNCVAGSGCNGKTKISVEEMKRYDCGSRGENCYIIFKKAGMMVGIPFYYDFSYTVNASLDVQVMNKDLFLRKLLNKEFQSAWQTTGFISQYSGGPVTFSIYTQKQPLRDDEVINCRIGLQNNGQGTLKKEGAVVKLRIPVTSGISLTQEPKDVSLVRIDKCTWASAEGYREATCKLSSDLKPTETATYLFSYKFKLDPSIPIKDLLYVGDATYTYTTREDVSIAIADAPIQ
ncbi:MAG: hypothetical protein QXU82_02140 [Candidatus Aenigmatarchaeota archaeon]